MRYISLFIIFTILSNAFEIEMIDETLESKENTKAKDGKIIYKPIKKKIIEPIEKNIITPIKRKIYYPIGKNQPIKELTNKKIDKDSKKNLEKVFANKEDLNGTLKKEEIKVDKFFKGLKETNKTKKITPVNIE